jgi:hypothetical protein
MGCVVALTVALTAVACGGDDPLVVQTDPAVAPFVGTWDAVDFTVTNDADTTTVPADLLKNGSFTINIQPSGLYTATLVLGALNPFVEIGQLTVSGSVLTLTPTGGPGPCPASSVFEFPDTDTLVLDGPTCLDVNGDGEDEDAQAHIVLERRPS